MQQYQCVMIMERSEGWKPNNNVDICPNCPRCGSSNTKFCYYNNYSLSQPRYFCKGCRRYWTKGGSLRNIPVGGGCRKHHRRGATTKSSSSSSLRFPSTQQQLLLSDHHSSPNFIHNNNNNLAGDSSSSASGHHHSADSANKGESHIDIALVYANFLNSNPQQPHLDHHQSSNNNNKASDIIAAAEAHHQEEILGIRSSGLNIVEEEEGNNNNNNNNSIGFFSGWDSLSDLFADGSHLKVVPGFESPPGSSTIKDTNITSAPQIYNHHHHGVLSHHDPLHNMHQQCIADNNNTSNYFELPGGEGGVAAGSRETWSEDSHHDRLLLVDHSLAAATELLPIVINGREADQAPHQDLFIGSSNAKGSDFSGDDSYLSK